MKETTAYKSEFMVVTCPYCGHVEYLDVADDMGEGSFPEDGRKMTCRECTKTMRVLDY